MTAKPHNLPTSLTSFVGRERELAEVDSLLARSRLVTLTGAGGSGKTRLALEAAARSLPVFGDGVWLIELAALAGPDLLPERAAAALGLKEDAARPLTEVLTGAIGARRMLLILDNCEHLLAECVALVEHLLLSCRGVHVLATSREAFAVPWESTYPVPPLALPVAGERPPFVALRDCEALALFEQRAALARYDFRLTDENIDAAVEVCRRLDGMPLAIELAAARSSAMAPIQMIERLRDRLQFLDRGRRGAPQRHQTLRGAIDWSYELLEEPERRLFANLSVFAGRFTLEAAEAVSGRGQGPGIKQPATRLNHPFRCSIRSSGLSTNRS